MTIQVFDRLKVFDRDDMSYRDILIGGMSVPIAEYAVACLYEEEAEIHEAIARECKLTEKVKLSNVLRHNFTDYELQLKASQELSFDLKNSANVKATYEFMRQIRAHYNVLETERKQLIKDLRKDFKEADKEAQGNLEDFREKSRENEELRRQLLETQEKLAKVSISGRKIPRRLKENGDLEETVARLKKKNEQLDKIIESRDNQIRGFKAHRTKDGNVSSCLLEITGIKVNHFNKVGKAIGQERKQMIREAQEDILKFLAGTLGVKRLEAVAFELIHEA